MLLTSYERVRRYLSSMDGAALTSTANLKRDITNWIAAASASIEQYTQRDFELKSRTEYFDVQPTRTIWYLNNPPATTLTSVYDDPSGLWDGNESEIDECYFGEFNDCLVLPSNLGYTAKRGLRAIYTSGFAWHAVNTQMSLSGITGSFAAAKFVKGATSEAVGIVKIFSSPVITVETLFGKFSSGETIEQFSTEDCTGTAEASGVGTIVTGKQSLAELYPGIVTACEMLVRYYWKHKHDFEVSSTGTDGTNTRRDQGDTPYLTPEVRAMLNNYRLAVL